jgi:hypothetical protein
MKVKEENVKFNAQSENFDDFVRVLGETEDVLKRKVSDK